jgi:hypothetical protein
VVTVADDDAFAFSSQVLRLLRDRELRITLGKRAFSAARKWNSEQCAQLKLLVDEARVFKCRQLSGTPNAGKFSEGSPTAADTIDGEQS